MSLNKNKISIYFSIIFFSWSFAQEKGFPTDSIRNSSLDEVIVTGQINPTSIKKSVHNVIVINRKQIEQVAANNLADVLNFNLNLNIIPNAQTGRSTISFFGLDSEYFNILIDNIPMVSDNGVGNNIDLTQINLDNIERIEIVEGAMGVEYGANAVSGVINIITKTSIDHDWRIQAYIQEETVSDEYTWFDQGRHIQSINVAHNINEKWMAKIGVNRNDFAGFLNQKQGENYYQNDGLRGYEWLPKEQLTSNALLNYKGNNFRLVYKFEYFNERINFYDASVRANIETENQTSNPSATDKIYTTNRFVNNLNIYGQLNSGANYNVALSYQQQQRDLNEFNYYILSRERSNESDETYQSSKVLFSKGTLNNIFKRDASNFQLGYEARYMEGFDTQASGSITQQDKTNTQTNVAVFGTSEFKLSQKMSLRPGIRYEYNTLFHSKFLGSLSARYLMANGFELRGNLGTSYRVPNFEELYYYFVDSNHDVQGNEDLKPENGYSAFLNLKKRSWINNLSLINNLKISYLDVSDKIDLAVVNATPLQYQYINIDTYKLIGFTLENTLKMEDLSFNLGATVQGISRINNSEANSNDKFLYNLQLNTSASYFVKPIETAFTLLLKYNGDQEQYYATGTDSVGNSTFSLAKTEAYSWVDASVKKSFLDRKIEATLGARNLFDVTNVNVSSSTTGGTHSTSNNSLLLGYGRSFYLKLLYNLNF
ncbi:TonB-dependent receptor plug domain-containing protein [Winogradskyella arenosi]|uniref:Outer membrane receptor for ferrienterochelin and colicins n=1 Tax=Winogradskyella arenosi TaxID=533325 RepID=A0A368ZGT1_9FLAO|nr:TonB-dependent receptor [Winogradskyella arenosi]RCW92692.1 outer membrane receptor for ferrienterochelin and colicins [Winogradskyella arenosi]